MLKEDFAKLSVRSSILIGFKVVKELPPPPHILLKPDKISSSKMYMICVNCTGYLDRLSSESDKPLAVWMPLVSPRSSSTQRVKEMIPTLSTVLPCVGGSRPALYPVPPFYLMHP